MPVSTAKVTRANFKHAAHRPSAQNRGYVIKNAESPGGIGKAGATAGPPALRIRSTANGVALRRLRIDHKAVATSGKA